MKIRKHLFVLAIAALALVMALLTAPAVTNGRDGPNTAIQKHAPHSATTAPAVAENMVEARAPFPRTASFESSSHRIVSAYATNQSAAPPSKGSMTDRAAPNYSGQRQRLKRNGCAPDNPSAAVLSKHGLELGC